MNTSEEIDIDDQINLKDIILCLWAYKILIVVTFSIGVISGGIYALNADKKFTAKAIFKHSSPKANTFSFNSNLAALDSLGSFGSADSTKAISKEELTGRIFIEKLDKELNFTNDLYFNKYDPNYTDPIWKAKLKSIVGYERIELEVNELIWQGIVRHFSDNVALKTTKSNATEVSVNHSNPHRAAEIANAIMAMILKNEKIRNNLALDSRLDYLSKAVADALSDLEDAQSKLKTFAIENSALPLENFAAGSLQLDALRAKLNNTIELQNALTELEIMLENKSTSDQDYFNLSKKFPIVDQVEFRRVLGQNENISYWTWPNVDSVNAVLNTLTERNRRLKSQIDTTQIDAERSRRAYDIYARLQREAKIAEASYKVLIEGVKSQSMTSGFRPDNSIIFEYASPPVAPTSPNRNIIIIICAFIGIVLGAIFSFFIASHRKVYYSKSSIIDASKANYTASIKFFNTFRGRSISYIKKILSKRSSPVLRDLVVEINKSSLENVVITSSKAKLSSIDLAKVIAAYVENTSSKIAIINFSDKDKNQKIWNEHEMIGSFHVLEQEGNISILKPKKCRSELDFLSQRDFINNVQSLNDAFSLVLLCADNLDAVSLSRAIQYQKVFHINLSRTRYTKMGILSQICTLLPIQGLFHD